MPGMATCVAVLRVNMGISPISTLPWAYMAHPSQFAQPVVLIWVQKGLRGGHIWATGGQCGLVI